MQMRHVVLILVVAALLGPLSLLRSDAHTIIADDGTVVDWYPPQCCDNKDCRPVKYEYVYNARGVRTHVRMLVDGTWEQYPIAVLQRSKDHLAHWCGTVRPFSPGRFVWMECVFVPKGSALAPGGYQFASIAP